MTQTFLGNLGLLIVTISSSWKPFCSLNSTRIHVLHADMALLAVLQEQDKMLVSVRRRKDVVNRPVFTCTTPRTAEHAEASQPSVATPAYHRPRCLAA
jgi:hypothetical protein